MPSCSFAASDIRSLRPRRIPDDVDLRVGDAGHGLHLVARLRPAATAPPDSRARSASCGCRRRRRRPPTHRKSRPSSMMLTGISGSNTVRMASRIAGFSASVRAASATTPVRLRGRRRQVGRIRDRLDDGQWLHSVESFSSRSIAALSVCQARLAHLTRTGNSRTPASADSLPSSSTASLVGVVTIR